MCLWVPSGGVGSRWSSDEDWILQVFSFTVMVQIKRSDFKVYHTKTALESWSLCCTGRDFTSGQRSQRSQSFCLWTRRRCWHGWVDQQLDLVCDQWLQNWEEVEESASLKTWPPSSPGSPWSWTVSSLLETPNPLCNETLDLFRDIRLYWSR